MDSRTVSAKTGFARCAAAIAIAVPLLAVTAIAGLEEFTDAQVSGGLRDSILQGAGNAVAKLGRANGFLKNPKVKIPLPERLQKVDKLLRKVGLGKQSDDLVTAMNRAAEAAVPEAKTLFVDSVKQLSFSDAKSIATGGDHAATAYFRKTTEEPLRGRFLPIVTRITEKQKLAHEYDQLAEKAAGAGLVDKKDAKIEEYVTQKALDGLFTVMAEEERALRRDPAKAGSDLVRKIFGSLKR